MDLRWALFDADMTTLVSHVLESFSTNTCDSDGLFVMTTATDHKNSLNRSTIKKTFTKTLRVETIANSAGGTAAMVMQPSTGFLNERFLPDRHPTEDTEDYLGRITVGLTRSKSLTIVVSPLDRIGMIGMAQVLDTCMCHQWRRGISTVLRTAAQGQACYATAKSRSKGWPILFGATTKRALSRNYFICLCSAPRPTYIFFSTGLVCASGRVVETRSHTTARHLFL